MLKLPDTVQIPLKQIDISDPKYRYTLKSSDPPLQRSIAQNGVIAPVILQRKISRYRVVSGFKRMHIAKQLKHTSIPSLVFPADTDPLHLLQLSISENRSLRTLHPLEIASLIKKLRDMQISADQIITGIFPLLDLHPNKSLMEDYLHLFSFTVKLKDYLADHSISLKRCLVFRHLDKELQDYFARTMTEQSIGFNHIEHIIREIISISKSENRSVESLISSLGIDSILEDAGLERDSRISMIRQLLYSRSHPKIIALQKKLDHLISSADLPENITILWDPEFEKPGLLIQATIIHLEDLSAFSESLDNPGFVNMVRTLLEHV